MSLIRHCKGDEYSYDFDDELIKDVHFLNNLILTFFAIWIWLGES